MAEANPIERIQEKLQQLVRQQQRLRKEHSALQEELEATRTERDALAVQVRDLQQVVGLLKLAAGSLNDKEKKDFEKQINRYVREIDKCIAFLSS